MWRTRDLKSVPQLPDREGELLGSNQMTLTAGSYAVVQRKSS